MIDYNKSLIIVSGAQSNGSGEGLWLDDSTAGVYATYEATQSTDIDPKFLTTQFMVNDVPYDSDIKGDFHTGSIGYDNHKGSDHLAINPAYSFLFKLRDELNANSYTKNVQVCNYALGGTQITPDPADIDWTNEIWDEFKIRLKDQIEWEQAKGNLVEVVFLWFGHEEDTEYLPNEDLYVNFYKRLSEFVGYEPYFYFYKQVQQNALSYQQNIEYQHIMHKYQYIYTMDYAAAPNQDFFDYMESQDPTMINGAATSYTSGSDSVHFDWRACILMGILFFDTFMATFNQE